MLLVDFRSKRRRMSASKNSPAPISGVDWKSLPLSPREGFVLSRVDGAGGVYEIALTTGIPETEVEEILRRLAQLGAIRYAGIEPTPRTSDPVRPPGTTSSGPPSESATRAGPSPPGANRPSDPKIRTAPHGLGSADTIPAPRAADSAPVSLTLDSGEFAAELAEECDIDVPTRLRILELHRRLERLSHYDLLGVPRDAEKKDIKAGYFTLVNELHTDRFFGKRLGTFKTKLERIFAAATKAESTLTKAKLRAEYDRYLASRERTKDVHDSMHPSSSRSLAVAATVEIPKAPRPPNLTGEEEAAARLGEPKVEPPADRTAESPAPRAPDPEAMRRLLAKKFGMRGRTDGSEPSGSPPPSDPPEATNPEQVKKFVDDQMRARYDARNSSSSPQIANLLEMAKKAYEGKAYGPSLNALRALLSVAPEHVEANRLYREIQETADRELADQFAEQAKYEEADGHLLRAARTYERAARGKKSAGLYDKAANCILLGHGDRRKAVELSRMAVSLEGTSVGFRLTLAKAYDLAGMKTSALGEISRALELEPKNAEAKALLKALK